MGVVTVKVEVGNEYAPEPIRVIIDGKEVFESEESFDAPFTLDKGRHTIKIIGMNQLRQGTKASVSGNYDPNDSQESNQPNYTFIFIGDVK